MPQQQIGPNSVAAIEVYNPKEGVREEKEGNCVCCGEPMDYVGTCTSCALSNCNVDFDKPCSRTGEIDPLDLQVDLIGVD